MRSTDPKGRLRRRTHPSIVFKKEVRSWQLPAGCVDLAFLQNAVDQSRVAYPLGSTYLLPSGLLLARIEIRKLLPKVSNFWRIVIDDVRTVGMTGGVVLVVSLGGVQGVQQDHLRHDGTRENFGFLQLRDVCLGDSFLLIVVIENGRAILAA